MQRKIILLLSVALLFGCGKMFVKKQFGNEDQIVIKHATAQEWQEQAFQMAVNHCAQYGKVALLRNTDCGSKDYFSGAPQCFTTYECVKKKGE